MKRIKLTEAEQERIQRVEHPRHYTFGKIEVADFIVDQELSFCLGNVVKYICRAWRKDGEDPLEALEKGRWYLNREIKRIQESRK